MSGATSATGSPWYIVHADDEENARLIVSHIVLDILDDLKMSYPQTTKERPKELIEVRAWRNRKTRLLPLAGAVPNSPPRLVAGRCATRNRIWHGRRKPQPKWS
jgi:hypothetical protein